MVTLGFKHGENLLPVPVQTQSLWLIQVINPIKMK